MGKILVVDDDPDFTEITRIILQKAGYDVLMAGSGDQALEVIRESHPDVEWRDIVGFRNIAVHEYFAVNWSIVWIAATQDAPKLRAQVEAIIATEFAEQDTAAAEND